uniref:Interleukin-6 n=1 Tax=Oryzias sinensis TaxID=183150 RepID=A0A8C8A2F2_9TELE
MPSTCSKLFGDCGAFALPLFSSFISVLPPCTDPRLLIAALLLLCMSAAAAAAAAAALTDAPPDLLAGETSGEGSVEEAPPLASNIWRTWERLIEATKQHQKEFEQEFQGNVDYILLDGHKRSAFPVKCPMSNYSKEACLQRLAQGLLVYTVLLKQVEREYPDSSILREIKPGIPLLVAQIKEKMKRSERVPAPSSSQEEQLLKQLDSPDTFQRRMTAHSILSHLRFFLIDGKRAFRKWETPRRQKVNPSA